MNNPTIVVIAYNRTVSLRRLLYSLNSAIYPSEVRLIISVDYSGSDEVYNEAKAFEWKYGEKKIISHKKRLGLKEHILCCGDLVYEYENIIMLEDDLYVSPYFYLFSLQALNYFNNDDRIAGISLYSHKLNVNTRFPFVPIEDGSDIYFLQFASSWGQVLNKNQWNLFRQWYFKDNGIFDERNGLPEFVNNWPKTSWLKYFNKYLVEKNKYFVYPRISLTTNFNDTGTHQRTKADNLFQINLLIGARSFSFKKLNDSISIYDSHFEIIPEIVKKLYTPLKEFDFSMNLNCTKTNNQIKTDYVISIFKPQKYLFKWGMRLKPPELNIIMNICGEEIFLFSKKEFEKKYKRFKIPNGELFLYYYRMPKIKELIYFINKKLKNRIYV